MTPFAGGAFAEDLGDLGSFYNDYCRLMQHWKRVIKLPILDIHYEAMVGDFSAQVRSLLESLDLPWDDACLRFYQNPRHVGTASRDQVHRPIYSSSIGRWRKYQTHLDPLVEVLMQPGETEAR
jgi:hypothetical protein